MVEEHLKTKQITNFAVYHGVLPKFKPTPISANPMVLGYHLSVAIMIRIDPSVGTLKPKPV